MDAIVGFVIESVGKMNKESSNFLKFTALEVLNGLYSIKGSEYWKPH